MPQRSQRTYAKYYQSIPRTFSDRENVSPDFWEERDAKRNEHLFSSGSNSDGTPIKSAAPKKCQKNNKTSKVNQKSSVMKPLSDNSADLFDHSVGSNYKPKPATKCPLKRSAAVKPKHSNIRRMVEVETENNKNNQSIPDIFIDFGEIDKHELVICKPSPKYVSPVLNPVSSYEKARIHFRSPLYVAANPSQSNSTASQERTPSTHSGNPDSENGRSLMRQNNSANVSDISIEDIDDSFRQLNIARNRNKNDENVFESAADDDLRNSSFHHSDNENDDPDKVYRGHTMDVVSSDVSRNSTSIFSSLSHLPSIHEHSEDEEFSSPEGCGSISRISFHGDASSCETPFSQKSHHSLLIPSTPLSLKDVVTSTPLVFKLYMSARDKILAYCKQDSPITFVKSMPRGMLGRCKKIGEGTYGEVFRSVNGEGILTALKIIPIEGLKIVNDCVQKTFDEMLPEIAVSSELSDLRYSPINCCRNFVELFKVSCVKGKYPACLIKTWDDYHDEKVSLNDRPDKFPSSQLFVVFEYAFVGTSLEDYEVKSLSQAMNILKQVILALAVAERQFRFEHRDLHWGNVLIQDTDEKTISYVINGQELTISSDGILVTIIDFSLSRLSKDGCSTFCDLSQDEELFQGQGDLQFDTYRLMREENGGNWKSFCPRSNVLWLNYLSDKLFNVKCHRKNKVSANKLGSPMEWSTVESFMGNLNTYNSAYDVVLAEKEIILKCQ